MVGRFVALVGMAALVASGPALARDKDSEESKVMPNGDAIVCQKIQDTGSLVKKTKRCYTKKQWDRIALAARANTIRLQSDHATGDFYGN